MKIIIAGAGRVGASIVSNLARESNDLILIDTNADLLAEIQQQRDIATVCGKATDPDTLSSAGAANADMLIALTDSDETNMVACQVAHTLFGIPKKLARIRSEAFLKRRDSLFRPEAIPIDVVISPEEEVTKFIRNLILYPGSHQVLSFANGLLQLCELRARADGPLIGKSLDQLSDQVDPIPVRAAAIYRNDSLLVPKSRTVIQTDDRIFFTAPTKHLNKVIGTLLEIDKPYKRLMIAGGGRVGFALAKALERQMHVKIIVKNAARARTIAEQLDHTMVLTGDVADEALLLEENIDRIDVFCAVTNDDEVNIMSAMLAKRLGARKVMSLVDRPAYMEMVDTGAIDNAIFPQYNTIGHILAQVRHGPVSRVHSLIRGKAEALEVTIRGCAKSSDIAGHRIDQVRLPPGAIIVGVIRGFEVLPSRGSVELQEGDKIIVFIYDKAAIPAVESLLEPRKEAVDRVAN
ncbi:MAG: Trk system potassium transporter TrkA [Gammaproteobacteria bacterium]